MPGYMYTQEEVDRFLQWQREAYQDLQREFERERRVMRMVADEFDRVCKKLAEATEHRDYAIEVKQNCDKIIADLMNERDEARKVARVLFEDCNYAPGSLGEAMPERYPWLKRPSSFSGSRSSD